MYDPQEDIAGLVTLTQVEAFGAQRRVSRRSKVEQTSEIYRLYHQYASEPQASIKSHATAATLMPSQCSQLQLDFAEV